MLTDTLAACLERFLEGTADEGTLSRGRQALEARHILRDPLPVRPRAGSTALGGLLGEQVSD